MARGKKLTNEERDALAAQAESLRAGIGQAARDSALKEQIARAQIGSDQEINASKIGLGEKELGQKDRQGNLAAAIEALASGSKERIAREGERGQLNSDLTKIGLDKDLLASTLAENGAPGLYNAQARQKLAARETAVNAAIPELQKPNSGGEAARSKKFKAALEATAGPGAYDEALARAYPDTAGGGGKAPEPQLFKGSTSSEEKDNFGALAGKLLAKGGVADDATGTATSAPARTGYPELPNTPETRYNELGQGSLEGSKLTDEGGGRSRIATPSGGSIGFNTPQTERRAGLLGQLIGDKTVTASVPAPAGINDLVKPPNVTEPEPTTAPVAQAPTLPVGVLPQPTLGPAPTPTPNLAELLELAKRRQQVSSY